MDRARIITHGQTLRAPFSVEVKAYGREGETFSGFSVTPVGRWITDVLRERVRRATGVVEKLISEGGEDYLTIREAMSELPDCASWCLERAIMKALADMEDAHFADHGGLWACLAKPGPHKIKRGAV